MKHLKYSFVLVVSILLAACGTANQAPEKLQAATTTCYQFGNLATGSSYSVGDTLPATAPIFSQVRFMSFQWNNGQWTSNGVAQVQANVPTLAGGTGSEMMLNNITFRFLTLNAVSEVELHFGEYGGNLNLAVNGDYQNFENFQDVNGAVIGGVTVSVPAGGFGNDQGTLVLTGNIFSFRLGGQELWVDDICLEY